MRLVAAAVVVLRCALPAPVEAQQVPLLTLRPASGQSGQEFSSIVSVHETADGRVLVADAKEARYLLVDFAAGTAVQVGRKGEGPLEYPSVGRLWPVGGDSLVTAGTGSWTVFRQGAIVGSIPRAQVPIKMDRVEVEGSDLRGNLVLTVLNVPAQEPRTMAELEKVMADSTFLVRAHHRTGRADTLGRYAPLGGGTPVMIGAEVPAAGGMQTYPSGVKAGDHIVAFADGWIAINRGVGDRIDWCPPAGACVAGRPLGMNGAAMTDADKRAFMTWAAASGRSFRPGVGIDRLTGWPRTRPAFVAKGIALPDGRLLLERFPSAAQPKREYLVLDRTRGVVGRLELPLSEEVVAAGLRSVYVMTRDADDLLRLRRHPWP